MCCKSQDLATSLVLFPLGDPGQVRRAQLPGGLQQPLGEISHPCGSSGFSWCCVPCANTASAPNHLCSPSPSLEQCRQLARVNLFCV